MYARPAKAAAKKDKLRESTAIPGALETIQRGANGAFRYECRNGGRGFGHPPAMAIHAKSCGKEGERDGGAFSAPPHGLRARTVSMSDVASEGLAACQRQLALLD